MMRPRPSPSSSSQPTRSFSVKGKPVRQFFFSLFWSKLTKTRVAGLIGTLVLGIVYSSHRFAAYKVNNRTWVKAPINDMYRECPHPNYDVLGHDASTSNNLKICLTTLTDARKADFLQRMVRWRNFDQLLDMTWPNKRAYVQKHGYYLYDESGSLDTSRPPSWSKIKAAQRLLQEEACDWVFWLDADTVIMNSTIRIEDFLPVEEGKDLILTEQKGGSYNAGAWLIRNTQWSLDFLETWWNKKDFVKPKGMSVSGDNDALKDYLLSMSPEYFAEHIVVPPRCTFNSVTKFLEPDEAERMTPEELQKQHWYRNAEFYHKGDFVAHVAGRNNKITTTAMLLKDADEAFAEGHE